MPSSSTGVGHFASSAFFRKTYDETIALLVETRNYVTAKSPVNEESRVVAMNVNMETTRVTARLTQVIAWLMVQRAVEAGEISPAQSLTPKHRLGGQSICSDECGEEIETLPPELRDLLSRSRQLYQRVARLDEMIARDLGKGATH